MDVFVFSAGSRKDTKQARTYSRKSTVPAAEDDSLREPKRARLSVPSTGEEPATVDTHQEVADDASDNTLKNNTEEPPLQRIRKPLFSSWKRSKSQPLQDSKSERLNKPKLGDSKSGPPKRIQWSIDLGGPSVAVTCSLCGMNYIRTAAEDRALHKQVCADNASGIRLPRGAKVFTKRVWAGSGNKDYIAVVCRSSPAWEKELATKVLNLAKGELGSTNEQSEDVWCEDKPDSFARPGRALTVKCSGQNERLDDGHPDPSKGPPDADNLQAYPVSSCIAEDTETPLISAQELESHSMCHKPVRMKSKVYLYIRENTVVAALQAMPIHHARRVVSFSPLTVTPQLEKATLGVDKIWTARKQRRSGLAMQLLRTMQQTWEHGLVLEKENIAWSWTTESGKLFVQSWWGAEIGWLMFIE